MKVETYNKDNRLTPDEEIIFFMYYKYREALDLVNYIAGITGFLLGAGAGNIFKSYGVRDAMLYIAVYMIVLYLFMFIFTGMMKSKTINRRVKKMPPVTLNQNKFNYIFSFITTFIPSIYFFPKMNIIVWLGLTGLMQLIALISIWGEATERGSYIEPLYIRINREFAGHTFVDKAVAEKVITPRETIITLSKPIELKNGDKVDTHLSNLLLIAGTFEQAKFNSNPLRETYKLLETSGNITLFSTQLNECLPAIVDLYNKRHTKVNATQAGNIDEYSKKTEELIDVYLDLLDKANRISSDSIFDSSELDDYENLAKKIGNNMR